MKGLISLLIFGVLNASPALAADPTTDPCSLLTPAEVEQAIGKLRAQPKQNVIDRARMCDYELTNDSVGLSVWLLPAVGLERARKEYPELTAAKDVGGEAFIHRNERLDLIELFARKGNATLQMSVPVATGDAAKLQALARKALARL
jgi:hypothetical protein